MSRWADEKSFEKHFLALNDANRQIEDLAEWRTFQTQVVTALKGLIKLVASEQYENPDHFLLELLQNADDNEYPPRVHPTVRLTLEEKVLRLENNEKGFSPSNVFSITYSAASTKLRKKTSTTYIGEKGIGFKSVFAVADFVEIHSGPYHFRLDNDEFIVPRLVPLRAVEGTEIVLHLREGNTSIPRMLSERLAELCENAQEFLIFLQRIERLDVIDCLSGSEGHVGVVRKPDLYIVEAAGETRQYLAHRYEERIPAPVVQSRFSDRTEDLPREVVFAVPLPTNASGPITRNGAVFCFLPTKIRTGTPIHIQVDAKTTTNRENIVAFDLSPWNRALFSSLTGRLLDLYRSLAEDPRFAERLPEYLPWDAPEQELRNEDLKRILIEVKEALPDEPIIRDCHGDHFPASFVKRLPHVAKGIFYQDKYEKCLSRYYVGHRFELLATAEEVGTAETITLIDPNWSQEYGKQLDALGVEEVSSGDCIVLLSEGPPESVDLQRDGDVREFLDVVIDLYEAAVKGARNRKDVIKELLACPIFPLTDGRRTMWGPVGSQVMWLRNADSPDTKGQSGAQLIDARFTYSPGGSATRKQAGEEVRDFNRRMRDFLDTCGVASFSVIEHLRRTTIAALSNLGDTVASARERQRINEQWLQLFRRVWQRRRTVIRDEGGEEAWRGLLTELSRCKIPVRVDGTKSWQLMRVREAFLGAQFGSDQDLAAIYRGTGAGIIVLDHLKGPTNKARARRQQRVDWSEWAKFLRACGARTGPTVVEYDLFEDPRYRYSNGEAYSEAGNELAIGIVNAIRSEPEYSSERAKSFSLCRDSVTVALDKASATLIGKRQAGHFIAQHLSPIWGEHVTRGARVSFLWGQKYTPRSTSTSKTLLEDQLRPGLLIKTDTGVADSRVCFEDTPSNRRILGDLGHYIDYQRSKYAPALMRHIGVRGAVTVDDLLDLIRAWHQEATSQQRTTKGFIPYLQLITRFAREMPEHRGQLRSAVQLFSPSSGALVSWAQWKDNDAAEYPADVAEQLSSAIEPHGGATAEMVIDAIGACAPLEVNAYRLAEALADVGRFVEFQSAGSVVNTFEELLRRKKLIAFGKTISDKRDLPLLWDTFVAPPPTAEVLVVRVQSTPDHLLALGADTLSWPRLTRKEPTIEYAGRPHAIDKNLAQRAYAATSEIFRGTERAQPQLMARIQELGLLSSADAIEKKIVFVDKLGVKLRHHQNHRHFRVPYWHTDGRLYVDVKETIEWILPDFLDRRFGTTFASTFHYVWEHHESQANPTEEGQGQRDKQTREPEPPDRDAAREHEGGADTKTTGSGGGGQGGSGSRSSGAAASAEARKEIARSYVLGGDQDPRQEAGSKSQVRSETDRAGIAKVVEYERRHGRHPVEMAHNHPGYDVESKDENGDSVRYIEVKSLTGAWTRLGAGVSQSQFEAARSLGDKFWLYVVEKAQSAEARIHAVRDPARRVNDYRFDEGWKALADETEVVRRRSILDLKHDSDAPESKPTSVRTLHDVEGE